MANTANCSHLGGWNRRWATTVLTTIGIWLLAGCAPRAIDGGATLPAGEPWIIRNTGALRDGGRQQFVVRLREPEALVLRVPFEAAPFNGTQLLASVNGARLLPYFAFGGDTRYDTTRDKPGMRPPIATIEGRWVIPPMLLRAGMNQIELWTTGVTQDEVLSEFGPRPVIDIPHVSIARADGGELPRYANSIYYDFAVWRQGYDWGEDSRRYYFDQALLGIISGGGMPSVLASLGGTEDQLWTVKRSAEELALRWGYSNQEFYTIWEFAAKPALWARYVDADGSADSPPPKIQGQAIYPHVLTQDPLARGAEVVLYDPQRYAAALEPAIRALAPYATYYNFKCEQHGPWGQGFGDDGRAWERFGVTADTWASNYYEAAKTARDLVRRYDPEDGRVQEMNHWLPSIRHALFDSALRRGQPMSDIIDILATHFGSLASYDVDANGHMVPGETLQRQYPGGMFTAPPRPKWIDHIDDWYKDTMYPEVAIDFNRYRLGRTERDLLPALDAAKHRWSNGQPFDYRAGFRGDEFMYNSENGIWQGYSARLPYQYLQGVFAYGLLPTGAHEPRDLTMTTRQSLTQTTDIRFNMYGTWVDGVGHTKRLRTVDPLYGDMFGWTGSEHCNSGDFLFMPGIKDRHHRFPPYDAYGLVRRVCYAFITSGMVVPSYAGAEHDDSLFVKTVAQVFDGQRYIGVYAVNFDDRARRLDVILPVPIQDGATALVFDERAADWSDAQRTAVAAGDRFHYRQQIPAKSPYLVLLPMHEEGLAAALGLPPSPRPISPRIDEAVDADHPTVAWAAPSDGLRYRVEIAREATFRESDRVELSEPAGEASYVLHARLEPRGRYFWRVQAIDASDRRGEWSAPRPFVYRWPEYAQRFPAQADGASPPAPEKPQWQVTAELHRMESSPNLAWSGEIYGTGGHMHSPSRACDGQAYSNWSSADNDDGNEFALPAEWAVIWAKPVVFESVKILWLESARPNGYAVQISNDAQTWTDLLSSGVPPDGPLTQVKLEAPVSAKYLRIAIPAAVNPNREVGIREVLVQ